MLVFLEICRFHSKMLSTVFVRFLHEFIRVDDEPTLAVFMSHMKSKTTTLFSCPHPTSSVFCCHLNWFHPRPLVINRYLPSLSLGLFSLCVWMVLVTFQGGVGLSRFQTTAKKRSSLLIITPQSYHMTGNTCLVMTQFS